MEEDNRNLQSLTTRADLLKSLVDGVRPLTETQQRKLDQKLRLDWNYHSNSIEGNTLTVSETRAFILHGITAKGKPFRDYIEMKGHDQALKKLESIINKDTKITESLIKELHKIILVEPYTDDAAEINPGAYKKLPNYLYTATGERLDFLAPEEVAAQMNKLINWLNNHIEPPKRKRNKYDLHPILIATAFHVRFIQIHPFGDGNGRMARIMGNLILMLCGYTPAIIKLEQRKEYYAMLNLSTLENPQPLAEMIAAETIRTLQMTLDVSKGLPIDEDDDLDKEISLILAQNKNKGLTKGPNVVFQVFEFVQEEIWEKLQKPLSKFDQLFSDSKTKRLLNGYKEERYPEKDLLQNPLKVSTKPKDKEIFGHDIYEEEINSIVWEHTKYGLNVASVNKNIEIKLIVEFELTHYTIKLHFEGGTIYENAKLYADLMFDEDYIKIKEQLSIDMLAEVKKSNN
ncbi:MAG: Fic family protein [Aequorivita sp.]|nr:Fic family protein [Aequorivita sp.]